jgi:digeranylgeranylglycerophospholipid reductase
LEYDVAVVGAGPAGCVAARYASMKGARCIIIDRKRDIGTPVRCAEVVAGTLPSAFDMKRTRDWLVNEAHYFKLVSGRGTMIRIKTSPYTGYVLDRAAFEKELAEMAVEEGAELILGKTVTGVSRKGVAAGNEKITAKMIIAADGVDSRMGRLAGLKTRGRIGSTGSCAQHTLTGIQLDADCLEFHLGRRYASGGYAWVFPKNKNEANVGVGILKSPGNSAIRALKQFTEFRFPKGQSIRFTAGCVPSDLPPAECVKGNVVLVGDAARQVNPFSGAGIANSFVAGRIAGEVCGEIASQNLPIEKLKEYDARWRQVMEKKLKKSLRLRDWVLFSERNTELFLFVLKIMPGFVLRRLARQIHY